MRRNLRRLAAALLGTLLALAPLGGCGGQGEMETLYVAQWTTASDDARETHIYRTDGAGELHTVYTLTWGEQVLLGLEDGRAWVLERDGRGIVERELCTGAETICAGRQALDLEVYTARPGEDGALYLLASQGEGTVDLYRAQGGALECLVEDLAARYTLAVDGQNLYAIRADGGILRHNLDTGRTVQFWDAPDMTVQQLFCADDGRLYLLGSSGDMGELCYSLSPEGRLRLEQDGVVRMTVHGPWLYTVERPEEEAEAGQYRLRARNVVTGERCDYGLVAYNTYWLSLWPHMVFGERGFVYGGAYRIPGCNPYLYFSYDGGDPVALTYAE